MLLAALAFVAAALLQIQIDVSIKQILSRNVAITSHTQDLMLRLAWRLLLVLHAYWLDLCLIFLAL